MALTEIPIELSSTPGIVDNSNATAITIDSSENVGIGVSNPSDYYSNNLVVTGPSEGGITIASTGNHTNYLLFADSTSGVARYAGMIEYAHSLDQMAFRTNSIQRMAIDSTGSIISSMAGGVFLKNSSGGTSATQILVSNTGGSMRAGVESSSGGAIQTGTSAYAAVFGNQSNYPTQFTTNGTVRATIDASGHLMVGTTDTAPGAGDTNPGVSIRGGSDNRSYFSVNGDYVMHLNRNTNDGSILEFARRGTNVGTIGVDNIDLFVSFSQTNNIGIKSGVTGGTPVLFPCGNTGSARDNAASWGYANGRWKEIFAVNGSINTSDRNEKQDIAELTDAEQRVAVACKGLLRKFRWIDAVEAKGDDARIHFGIIAQDLQAAFEAEGLDAARYAMFTSNTWWETQTEVAAVEAVEATEDTEAIEAVDAYTRTDTYDTAEEAPEGATERTRLGVRYSELLAFIIAAI